MSLTGYPRKDGPNEFVMWAIVAFSVFVFAYTFVIGPCTYTPAPPTATTTPVPVAIPQRLGTVYPSTSRPLGCPGGCTVYIPGCDIKGNIAYESGERIYHMPGQEYYEETEINPIFGERWFCTELEAGAAGWRKARK